ncbi:MAG TPA: MASE1 domain-containing protein, partial [Opitutus sp.]|nr:MASE1 domain-containing protein [Opitutus sp.]
MESITGRRAAVVYLAYFLLHAGFDASARLFEVAPGVSLWYPPVGLALALSTMMGVRAAPAVLAASFYSALLTSTNSESWTRFALPVLITTVYVAAGVLVRHWFGPVPTPQRPLRTAMLVAIYLAAPLLSASIGSALVIAASHLPPGEFFSLSFGWWIGDLTGVLTVVPICLVHIAPALMRQQPAPQRNWTLRERLEIVAQTFTLLAFVGIVHGFGYVHPHQTYYLCFVPLVWICLRHGLPGATIAVLALTMGTLFSLQITGASNIVITDLVLFEIAVATIGLGLGA